jgi:hypothetical protein
MPANDLPTQAKCFVLLASKLHTADIGSTALDLSPFDGGAIIIVSVGIVSGGTKIEYALQESPNNSDWTTVSDTVTHLTGGGEAVKYFYVRPQDSARYVRIVIDETCTNYIMGVTAVAMGQSDGGMTANTFTYDSRS